MVGSVRDVESRNSKPNRTKMRGWSEGIHKGVVREKTAVCNCRSGAGLCGRWPGTGRGPGLYRSDRARELRGRRRSEEHTSELQSQSNLVCRLLLEKKKDKLG